MVSEVVAALVAERQRRGISQNALAKRSGLSQSGFRYIELGKAQPTLASLLRISRALDMPLGPLVGRAEKNPESMPPDDG